MTLTVEDIIRDDPKFHETPEGFVSWKLEPDALRYIGESVNSRSRTLETGGGVSTVVFALLGATHFCVNPKEAEAQRIKAYCRSKSIDSSHIHFILEKSEFALPNLKESGFDLILIDGAHKFPIPFLDWYYTADKLKVGGILIIDDMQHWTGYTLRDFLLEEPEWKLAKEFTRAVAFRKLKQGSTKKWWAEQPFIVKRDRKVGRNNEVKV